MQLPTNRTRIQTEQNIDNQVVSDHITTEWKSSHSQQDCTEYDGEDQVLDALKIQNHENSIHLEDSALKIIKNCWNWIKL